MGKDTEMSNENSVRLVRKKQHVTLEELSARTGLSVSYLGRIEKGDRNLSLKNMKVIATALQVKTEALIPISTTSHRIRLLGEVEAGNWRGPEGDWSHTETYDLPLPEVYRHRNPFALRVVGPSMNLVYPEGTILICCQMEELRELPLNGKRYIIENKDLTDGTEFTVKELVIDADGRPWAWPRSNHPAHQQPIPLDKGREGHVISIKARVIFSMKGE